MPTPDHHIDQINSKEGSPTILVIDDEPQNISVLADLLKEKGYQIRAARDASQALKSLEIDSVDLILLDVRMPGLSGFEMCEQLKSNKRTARIPIIFLTVMDETGDKVKGLELGAVDYITKPFDLDEVIARVGRQLKLRTEYKSRGNGEYEKTGLDKETRLEICGRLTDYFEREGPYLSPDLDSATIANKIDVSQHNLSEAVNIEYKQNIPHFINKYRIEHFCTLIELQPDSQILALALQSGYSSKSVFNHWFKIMKKTTPRQYIQSLAR